MFFFSLSLFYVFEHKNEKLKKKESLDCTYLLLWLVWTEEEAEWRSRWERTKIYGIRSIQSSVSCSLITSAGRRFSAFLHNYHVSPRPSGILTTVYSILHIYTTVYCSHKSKSFLVINHFSVGLFFFFLLHTTCRVLRRSRALHYSSILWTMILSVFIKRKKCKVSSCIAYSVKA